MDDHFTTSSKRNETTDYLRMHSKKRIRKRCSKGVTTNLLSSGDLHGDLKQGAESGLSEEVISKLSKSVVSLALSNGHMVLFACSGVAVERAGCVTRFLTTARLVIALKENSKDHDNLKIEVLHEDNVVVGFLGEYDFKRNVAAVNVKDIPGLCAISFPRMWKTFVPHSKVVSLGRDTSGKLIVTYGTWEKQTRSSCKISKKCEGGPLVDLEGCFIGINLYSSEKGIAFLSAFRVFEQMNCCKYLEDIEFPAHVGERLTGETSNSHQGVNEDFLDNDLYGDLESLGYPECPKSASNGSMVLVNNFEDIFGDTGGAGVWSELSGTVVKSIEENTVALASFNERNRHFACTGFFIDWDGRTTILTSASLLRDDDDESKIVENLRIEVLLNNGQRVEGTLQHYNLHYNVALVSVKECPQPAKNEYQWDASCVLAVGRNFTSGRLMGAKGKGTPLLVIYDCSYLRASTCRITKAGIGGPLLAFDGKFVGMNFYQEGEAKTPFLSWSVILDVLNYFKTIRTVAEVGHDAYSSRLRGWTIGGDYSSYPNRWPVPKPYWYRRDALDNLKDIVYSKRPFLILI